MRRGPHQPLSRFLFGKTAPWQKWADNLRGSRSWNSKLCECVSSLKKHIRLHHLYWKNGKLFPLFWNTNYRKQQLTESYWKGHILHLERHSDFQLECVSLTEEGKVRFMFSKRQLWIYRLWRTCHILLVVFESCQNHLDACVNASSQASFPEIPVLWA